jgi:small-conductance mechanosensitive channel
MVAIITVLPEFGVNVAPILAGLGLVGLAVGMAAKDILTDFIAGFFIIIEGEYNIGDKVKIAGVTGKVMEVSLRRTILEGKGASIHIVPNREIKLIKRFAGKKITVE